MSFTYATLTHMAGVAAKSVQVPSTGTLFTNSWSFSSNFHGIFWLVIYFCRARSLALLCKTAAFVFRRRLFARAGWFSLQHSTLAPLCSANCHQPHAPTMSARVHLPSDAAARFCLLLVRSVLRASTHSSNACPGVQSALGLRTSMLQAPVGARSSQHHAAIAHHQLHERPERVFACPT